MRLPDLKLRPANEVVIAISCIAEHSADVQLPRLIVASMTWILLLKTVRYCSSWSQLATAEEKKRS